MSVLTDLLKTASTSGYGPSDVSYSDMRAVLAFLLDDCKTRLDAIASAIAGGASSAANVKPAIAVQVQLAGAPQVSLAGVARYPNGAPTLFVTAIIWAYATNKQPILLAPFNAGVADSNMQPVLPNQYFSLDNTGRIGDLADHGVKSSDAYSVVTYYWYPV